MLRNIFFIFAISGTISHAYADVSAERRCLESDNKKIRLELVMVGDAGSKWQGGFVQYGKKKAPITIVYASSQDMDLGTRQDSTEQTWLEIVGKDVTGTYEFDTNGAAISGFRYTGKKNGKAVGFTDISGSMDSVETQCLTR